MRARARRLPGTALAASLSLGLGLCASACSSTPAPPAALSVGASANGKTVTVAHKQQLVVTLSGPSWRFSVTPPFGILTEVSSEQKTGGHPGRDATRVTATFAPGRAGGATIDACQAPCPKTGGGFVLHVVVTR